MEHDKNQRSEEEFEPKTQEKAELVPPVRRPPTAVGTGTPPPPPPSGPAPAPHGRPMLWYLFPAVRRSLAAVVDLTDAAADMIVKGLAGRA